MQGLTKAAMSESHEVTDDLGGHHFSFDDLWYSAKTCPLCRLFILAFEDRARDTSGQNAQRLENASKEGGRFKIWARNTDLDNRLKQDEALTRLVLQWIGNSGKYEEIELLLVASPGKNAKQLLPKIHKAQLQKIAQLRHTSTRILQSAF